MPKEELTTSQTIDLLMKEYGDTRQELIQAVNRVKTHVRHFQIVLSAIIALFALVIGRDAPLANSRLFWLFIGYSVTTVVMYVVFDLLESQFGIEILGARCSILEERINRLAGTTLLVWDSHVIQRLYDIRKPIKGVWHPILFLTAFQFLIIAITIFSVPAYSIAQFWWVPQHSGAFHLLVLGNIFYSFISFVIISVATYQVPTRTKDAARKLIRAAISSTSMNTRSED